MDNQNIDTEKMPFVSVIIPVYNDADALDKCLHSLDAQSYPHDLFEVIVVDNDSEIKIDKIVKKYKQTVLTHEAMPGSYAARNRGISLAKGEIIGFTDSDCVPAQDWIKNAVNTMLEKPAYGIVAGKITLFFKSPQRLHAVEVYEKIKAFNQKGKVENDHHGVTANLFTYKHIFVKEGLFDARLKSGGDVEWCQRIHAKGYNLLYADEVCVAHPARNTFYQLYRKIVRVAGGINDWNGKKQKDFILIVFQDILHLIKHTIWLTVAFAFKFPFSKNFNNTRQKIQYIFVVFFVGTMRIFEKTRLHVGGSSRR